MWWPQGVFLVFSDIGAESVEMKSSVVAVWCDLEGKAWAGLFPNTQFWRLAISCHDFFFTSGDDIHPTSWLSVWGTVYFLVGSSRAMWKALMKSAEKANSKAARLILCIKSALFECIHVINSQFSVTTSVGFLDMGLSGRIWTEMNK